MPLSPGHGQAGRDTVSAASPPWQPGTPLALPKRLIKGICGAAEPGCNLALTVHLFQRLRQPGELVGSLITGRQAAGAAGRRKSCGRRAGGPRAASAPNEGRAFCPGDPAGDTSRIITAPLSQRPCHSSLVTASRPTAWLRSDRSLAGIAPFLIILLLFGGVTRASIAPLASSPLLPC